jgi:hypothetical protein
MKKETVFERKNRNCVHITKLMLQPLNAEEDFHKPVLREFLEAMNTRRMD